ncbi:hypothetical protein ACFQJC_05915 [Haloferax namakaokahaiae]|uniref:Ig-like domain-containing protein n=1 Tax=Haloferax namakaokahaiae TaxID=1748331 RepID=A0ABD5ZCN4_9EURY
MSRLERRICLFAVLLLVSGCVTTGQPSVTSPSATPARTSPPPTPSAPTTSTAAPTTATTTQPTTIVHADRVPFSVRKRDSSSHRLHVVISDDSDERYNGSVSVASGESRRILVLSGEGETYHVHASTENDSLETNVTLSSGLQRTSIVVNESGKLEVRSLLH